jgi:hypothetical protein
MPQKVFSPRHSIIALVDGLWRILPTKSDDGTNISKNQALELYHSTGASLGGFFDKEKTEEHRSWLISIHQQKVDDGEYEPD